MAIPKVTTPTIFVLFGVTGDLVKRKILVGMYHLYCANLLPGMFSVVGLGRSEYSNETLRAYLRKVLEEQNLQNTKQFDEFLQHFFYLQGDIQERDTYSRLGAMLGQVDGEWKTCANKLFYLSVSPVLYEPILEHLRASNLTQTCSDDEGWTRVILEKPFGTNLEAAKTLDAKLTELFKEEQVYRVDHYLAKETVRNILAFRFSNQFLVPAWNKESIERIDITVSEKMDVLDRGAFYDGVGALRDFGQNHMLQLLALFTMDNPKAFDADSIRRARVQALKNIHILEEDEINRYTARGQYEGYTQTKGVDSQSTTETFFAAQLHIEQGALAGVPVYMSMGKALQETRAEVRVTFKHVEPCFCFPHTHGKNVLRYTMQPDEKITMSFLVKEPGYEYRLSEQEFVFDYQNLYSQYRAVTPYEQLLLDIISGDQTLFVSTEEVLEQWAIVEPILQQWHSGSPALLQYIKGAEISSIFSFTE